MKKLGPTDLKRLHREWARRSTARVALLLEGVTSPYNVGTIARTAAAFKVEHLYLGGGTTSPGMAKAAKTAAGAERYLSWSTFERGPEAADAAREDGFAVVGLEPTEHAVPLFQLSVGPNACIAVGSEDHGLTAGTLAACDAVAFIPQLGRGAGLDVATAAALALFEVRRRDWSGGW